MIQLSAKLNELFADLDDEVLQSSKQWAIDRVQALKEFKQTEEYKELNKKGAWGGVYDKLFAIAGGKTWYTLFSRSSATQIEEFVVKNCKAIADKRNASIATKLAKAGVKEVISEEFTHSRDGFNGIFIVHTDAGNKCVTIETIRAGGYNIQALHLRVLVKVK
jgi:hypothetical protein